MKKIDQPLELARLASADYISCYGEALRSVTVYGSAAGGDFDPRRSDISLLAILDKATVEAVERSASVQEKWLKQRVGRPLFMDRDYLTRSLDSFPIEFLNMRLRYTVVHGEDFLGSLVIDPRDLRMQAERELRGKWLHLIRDWLEVRSHKRRLQQLLHVSLRDFTAVFRALLHLQGHPVPQERKALWAAVTRIFELPQNPFEEVYAAALSGKADRMREVFAGYIRAIEIITTKIDHLPREGAS